jgi:uncharacterized protein
MSADSNAVARDASCACLIADSRESRVTNASSQLHLDAAHARRFLVARQFLAPPRALRTSLESIMAVVERFGCLQFDPLEVPGARNHDLVLHARIAHYDRGMCESLLYAAGSQRRLFEAYNKSLNILPVDELPWHRITWKKALDGRVHTFLREHRKLVSTIVARLERDGALSPSDFDQSEKTTGFWGTDTSLVRHLLEMMFLTGQVAIARRDGNKRTYDLPERLFSPEHLQTRVRTEEAHVHRLLSRHRAVGLMGEGGAGELIWGTGTAADRKRRVASLVERGVLIPARIEGMPETRYVLGAESEIVALTRTPSSSQPHVSFIPPLDPLMWDRRLVKRLFAFSYTWEVYTPEVKRAYGYYVLPILFGDRLVGRIEPIFRKATRTLHVAAMWLEPEVSLDEPYLVGAIRDALTAYVTFVGAEHVTFGRTKLVATLKRAWLQHS